MIQSPIKKTVHFLKNAIISFSLLGILASCNSIPLINQQPATSSLPTAEVVFKVFLPAALPQNTNLDLEIVDDVTGLAFNPSRYEMTQQDDRDYFVKIPLTIGSVVKYRYVRQANATTPEYSPQGTQVRFRLADITGPAIIQDYVAAWIDQPYKGPIGRVKGQFIDKANNAPIPNLLITAEGVQTITSSDGSFILEGLTPGTHTIVAYSMDGQYKTFSQGVSVADEATTPVLVYLEKNKSVTVTFNVSLPKDLNTPMPLRFASNSQALGNVYADLMAGSTTIAANLPVLTQISEGHYQIKLQIPSGFDLRYKYTFGDGLWNSELKPDGSFFTRELIVPNTDLTINDVVDTFQSPNLGPVSFEAMTTDTTPAGENLSIQFNPFGWFEPIPMTKVNEHEWSFTLYSPLGLFGPIEYRFCRNDTCDFSQAVVNSDEKFTPSPEPQNLNSAIENWTNYTILPTPPNVVTEGGDISVRTDLSAGFEITARYSPNWPAYIDSGFKKMTSTGANTVVLTPTWTATRNNPPYFEPVPGSDISWPELQINIIQAEQDNLAVALFPILNYPNGAASYWSSAKLDAGWWNTWFDRYHRYMMDMADLAMITGVKTIIVGDPTVSPSMTGGALANGKPSGAPASADEQWRQLIQDMRTHFKGQILGAVMYPNKSSFIPAWLDSVDGIYALYSPALSQTSNVSVQDLEKLFQKDLENNFYPKISGFNKSVWLGLNYPSSTNAFSGCTDILGSCLSDWGNGQVDLVTQEQIYNAAVIAAPKEKWISGFIARGTQPSAAIIDGSASTLYKPANDALWFWYHFLLNKTP